MNLGLETVSKFSLDWRNENSRITSVFRKEITAYVADKNEKWDEEKLSEQYDFLQRECKYSPLSVSL